MADRTALNSLKGILSTTYDALCEARRKGDTREIAALSKQVNSLETEIRNIEYNITH